MFHPEYRDMLLTLLSCTVTTRMCRSAVPLSQTQELCNHVRIPALLLCIVTVCMYLTAMSGHRVRHQGCATDGSCMPLMPFITYHWFSHLPWKHYHSDLTRHFLIVTIMLTPALLPQLHFQYKLPVPPESLPLLYSITAVTEYNKRHDYVAQKPGRPRSTSLCFLVG